MPTGLARAVVDVETERFLALLVGVGRLLPCSVVTIHGDSRLRAGADGPKGVAPGGTGRLDLLLRLLEVRLLPKGQRRGA